MLFRIFLSVEDIYIEQFNNAFNNNITSKVFIAGIIVLVVVLKGKKKTKNPERLKNIMQCCM